MRWAKQAGLAVTGHFVLGFPGETKETAKQTIRFALDEPVDFAQFYCAVPFPGSPLYERAKKEGLLTTTDWSKFEQNFCILSTTQLSVQEAAKLREEAFRKFYFSPSKALGFVRLAWQLGSLKNLRALSKEFKEWMAG